MNRTTQKMLVSVLFGFVFLLVESSRGQTTILSEGFEGAFPGNWSVGDANPSGIAAYWKDVDLRSFGTLPSHGSNWAGFCAGVGYGGTTPNPTYQNDMAGYMAQSLNLVGYRGATLSFWYVVPSIVTGNDFFRVFIDKTLVFQGSSVVAGWTQVAIDLTPYVGGTPTLEFDFVSDALSVAEGAYVDDILVTATLPPPSNDQCGGAIGMTAGALYTVNTAYATSAGDPTPGCQSNFGKGVWFSFTPLASGPVTISTCGSDFDTVIEVFAGSCGALTAVSGGCDDDNGPMCTGSQASVSFTGRAGTTYRILAGGFGGASGDLSIVASRNAANALTIIPTFDSSITSDPQAAAIEATISAAVAVYQSNFTDPVTVSIKFQKVNTGLGASLFYQKTFSYSAYRAALVAHATTADDATALAYLANSGNNPVNNNQGVNLNLSLARALGFNVNPPAGEPDGTISLNISAMNLSAADTDPTKYSLVVVACHEIDEVLGFGSALNGLNNGDANPTGPVSPEDLFRYDQNGARSLTTALNAISYFSLDGVSDLARFNQNQAGDFGDWYSTGGQTPQVQDAFVTPGAAPGLGVELRALDVIGYNPVPPPKSEQTIAFNPLPNKALGEASFSVNATASSGLAVSFNILSGPATISGNTVTITGTGAVVVRALQAGNADYNTAPSIDQLFTVYSAPPVSLTQSGSNLVIRWPTNVAGFVLEGAPSLTPVISWSPVSPTSVVNGQHTASVTVGSGNRFYRLRK